MAVCDRVGRQVARVAAAHGDDHTRPRLARVAEDERVPPLEARGREAQLAKGVRGVRVDARLEEDELWPDRREERRQLALERGQVRLVRRPRRYLHVEVGRLALGEEVAGTVHAEGEDASLRSEEPRGAVALKAGAAVGEGGGDAQGGSDAPECGRERERAPVAMPSSLGLCPSSNPVAQPDEPSPSILSLALMNHPS
eukprot:scaffold9098_cov124-Isochrysis_galbana.AAC.7